MAGSHGTARRQAAAQALSRPQKQPHPAKQDLEPGPEERYWPVGAEFRARFAPQPRKVNWFGAAAWGLAGLVVLGATIHFVGLLNTVLGAGLIGGSLFAWGWRMLDETIDLTAHRKID